MQIVFPLVLLFVTSAVFGQNNEHAWKDADSWMIDDSEYFLPQDTGTCGRRPYDTSAFFNKNIRHVQNEISSARSESLLDKIVGGSETRHGEIPWQASLKINSNINGDHDFRHYCGAIIISEYWLLTAAHCVVTSQSTPLFSGTVDVLASFTFSSFSLLSERSAHIPLDATDKLWRVTVGEHHLHIEDPGQQTFEVEIFIHEQYDRHGYDYDITLLKIKPGSNNAGIQFNDYVQPICLPDSETYLQDGTELLVSGWGGTLPCVKCKEEPQLDSDVLLKAIVPLMNHEKCKQSYYPLTLVTDNMFCAGYDVGGIDACNGDSGGPVAVKTGDSYMLYGIVSWGYGCALPGKPGVYARVTAFLNWIDTTINSNSETFRQSMLPVRSE